MTHCVTKKNHRDRSIFISPGKGVGGGKGGWEGGF